jgi:FAD/FMN-containing dehydrogenase
VHFDFSVLRDRFHGTVLTPTDPGYAAARGLFNARIRTRPAALCQVADTDDVVTAVRFARDAVLPVSIRGGGHHACGFSLVDDGLTLDLRGLSQIRFDPTAATAVVDAGCGWRDVDRVTYVDFEVPGEGGVPHGFAGAGGDCPTVSNAGFSLGGGYGLTSRRYGLGCDHILSAELVDADGLVLRADEHENPDLYWALRGGGGGSFGVVTRLTYRLDPIPKMVIGGVIAWPLEQAETVFRYYRDYYLATDQVHLSLFMAIVNDPYPHGKPVLMVYGLYIGPPDEAAAELAGWRALGRPLLDSFGPTSYFDLQDMLGNEVEYGLSLKWRGGCFADGGFSDDAFASIVDWCARMPSGYSMARFDLLGGGAVGRVPHDATAFVHRSRMFNISIIAQWLDEREADANLAWTDGFLDSLQPYLSGEVYQNYADADLPDWASAYYGANYPRLQRVKAAYDPTDFFRHGQSIRRP